MQFISYPVMVGATFCLLGLCPLGEGIWYGQEGPVLSDKTLSIATCQLSGISQKGNMTR